MPDVDREEKYVADEDVLWSETTAVEDIKVFVVTVAFVATLSDGEAGKCVVVSSATVK